LSTDCNNLNASLWHLKGIEMNAQLNQPPVTGIIGKATVTHTVTYFIAGLLALAIFDYGSRFADPQVAAYMRQIDHPLVAAGPLFQPIRGALFGLVFYLTRESWMNKKRGWLVLWAMLGVIGIVSTFGPAPGSIEGLIYTTWGVEQILYGYPEVVVQSLLLAVGVWLWVKYSDKRWLTWLMLGCFVIALLLPVMGLLASQLI
jgi:hypothetical protein